MSQKLPTSTTPIQGEAQVIHEIMADLVLAPFRDIVAQGSLAIANAEAVGNDTMLKAAQALVKEGERALKKIEPMCLKLLEEYGLNFVNALKDNDEISHFIEDLNNLLYDFEDYVEADNFNADRVSELQGLSRKAVPRISHIIIRMKLESPPHAVHDVEATAASPTVAEPAIVIRQPPEDGLSSRNGSLPYSEEDLEDNIKYDLSFRGQKFEDMPIPSSTLQTPNINEEISPCSPVSPSFLNPWSLNFQEDLGGQRRETVASLDSAMGSEPNSEHKLSPIITAQFRLPQPAIPIRNSDRPLSSHIVTNTPGSPPELPRRSGRDSTSPVVPRITSWGSAASSANASVRSSVSDHRRERDSYLDSMGPIPVAPRASTYSLDGYGQSPYISPLITRPSPNSFAGMVDSDLEPVVLPPPSVPDGLIPVEEEEAEAVSPSSNAGSRLDGCTITLGSSFNQSKGFCEGAMEAIQGGLGIRHIKKQGLSTANIEVAKCKSCSYELEWKAVERDVNKEPTENFKSSGIGFRLRFLSKSHIHSRNVEEPAYGCLFCIQLRHTTHPNDATVFFSQRTLFAHLARHPRPLPNVPGLTVIQGEEIPARSANNYDIHVPQSPNPEWQSRCLNITHALASLPTATTVQTCRATPLRPMRMPPDEAEVLSFASGARIIGVKFPTKYQGEWCVGWADHSFGAIPVEAIRLDPPMKSDIRSRGSSTMKAVARWKFSVKDKGWEGGWLSFGKGETITNIGWSHQDHWCWWGMTLKGKSGIFPRSHIEPGTLMQIEAKPDQPTPMNPPKKPGLLSRISLRNRGGSYDGGDGNTSPREIIH